MLDLLEEVGLGDIMLFGCTSVHAYGIKFDMAVTVCVLQYCRFINVSVGPE